MWVVVYFILIKSYITDFIGKSWISKKRIMMFILEGKYNILLELMYESGGAVRIYFSQVQLSVTCHDDQQKMLNEHYFPYSLHLQ